jgi:hypothetical protein
MRFPFCRSGRRAAAGCPSAKHKPLALSTIGARGDLVSLMQRGASDGTRR